MNNTYTLENNRQLLQSIKDNGLLSGYALQKKGIEVHLSSDDTFNSEIYINAYSSSVLEQNLSKAISDLFHNPKAGIFQIAYERRVNYVPSHYPKKKIVKERLHNAVLFVLDSKAVLEKEKLLSKTQLAGEAKLYQQVEPSSLKKAFVPKHLETLFKSIFKDFDCIILDSTKEKFSLDLYEISIGCMTGEQCKIPVFEAKVLEYAKDNLHEKQPMMFHLFRLRAPSDEAIEHIQKEAQTYSRFIELNSFDPKDAEAVKDYAANYRKLKLLNEDLKNREIEENLKKFEQKRFEIILFSPLCEKGSLAQLKNASPDLFNIFFKIYKCPEIQEEELEEIFGLIESKKDPAIFISLFENLKRFFSNEGKLLAGYDKNDLKEVLESIERLMYRHFFFVLFNKFIKIPENLERFIQEIS